MTPTSQQLQKWLNAKEDEHLEFKEAKSQLPFREARQILRRAGKRGRRVDHPGRDRQTTPPRGRQHGVRRTGANQGRADRQAADSASRPRRSLHPDGRVLVFTAPSRPIGMPIAVEGAYWMRAGEDLAPMTPDMLRRIFDEAGPDFPPKSARKPRSPTWIRPRSRTFATVGGRSPATRRWRMRRAEQLLADADLVTPEGITYAALILLGKPKSLGRFLAQAEVIFEYRSSEAPGPANQRDEYPPGLSHVLRQAVADDQPAE